MPYQSTCYCHSHSNTIYEYNNVKHSAVKIMIHLQFRHIIEVNMLTIQNGFQVLLVVICLYMYISHNQTYSAWS